MTWDLFISHASEDKADVARPLAEVLQSKGVNVWYDEYTLKIGDGLRRGIDHGLANSRYGVVILSPSFFRKQWTQQELEGLFSLESPEGGRILPVWHQVTAADVKQFSRMLAGRVGIPTDSGIEGVVCKIISKVMIYRINDHYDRSYEIDLTKCEAHGTPRVPTWLQNEPGRISCEWLEKRLNDRTELRIYFNKDWCNGTWIVVDIWKQEGVVINKQQYLELTPRTVTTTTSTTTTTSQLYGSNDRSIGKREREMKDSLTNRATRQRGLFDTEDN